ncbi:MAG: hypothetical protein AABX38_06135 [Candidatus Micrarchaeota archaeon]
MNASKIIDIILHFITNKKVGLYQIVYGTRLNAKTVKRYLEIIEKIQSSGKIKRKVIGSMVFFRKD